MIIVITQSSCECLGQCGSHFKGKKNNPTMCRFETRNTSNIQTTLLICMTDRVSAVCVALATK